AGQKIGLRCPMTLAVQTVRGKIVILLVFLSGLALSALLPAYFSRPSADPDERNANSLPNGNRRDRSESPSDTPKPATDPPTTDLPSAPPADANGNKEPEVEPRPQRKFVEMPSPRRAGGPPSARMGGGSKNAATAAKDSADVVVFRAGKLPANL